MVFHPGLEEFVCSPLLLLSLCDLGSLGGPDCPAMMVGGGVTCGNPPKVRFAPAVWKRDGTDTTGSCEVGHEEVSFLISTLKYCSHRWWWYGDLGHNHNWIALSSS